MQPFFAIKQIFRANCNLLLLISRFCSVTSPIFPLWTLENGAPTHFALLRQGAQKARGAALFG